MMKVFNSICTGRVGVGAWYRPLSVFSISFFFSVCSMTMILCDFSLKCYCTNFGKIWWYLVWTQGYWPWLNTHFKNKCNFWSNPHKMEITLFLLQCMILGIKLSFIAIIQTEWRINSSEVNVTARNYDMLHFAESVLFARLRTGLLCSSDQKFIFIIKLTNIDQETSKVEGAKLFLFYYYSAPKYRAKHCKKYYMQG